MTATDRSTTAPWIVVGVVLLLLGARLVDAQGPSVAWLPQLPGGDSAPEPVHVPSLEPAAVRVPALGIDAEVIRLGLERDGSLEVPEDPAVTGWWAGGARPGALGPAVIVGHVDGRRGPAVFADLARLRAGQRIEVEGLDGRVLTFEVTHSEQHGKDVFPTEAVYGPTEWPELRLVTCGGRFDRRSGHYDDNVIVFARLVL